MNAKKTYLHILTAVILGALLMFLLPVGNGLTADGVHMLGILIPVIYLWITVGTDWVSLAAIIALVMTGVMNNGKNYYADVYAGSMGNFIIITVISCMALSAVLTQTGVIEKIATWFITRKFVQGRPYAFLFMFLLSNLIVGTFMEATAVAIMYIDLAKNILEKLGYKKGDKFYTVVMAGLYWNNSIVSAGSPISHVLPLLLIAAADPVLGVTISFGQWLMIGIPFEIMAFAIEMFVFRFIWKPDTTLFENYDLEATRRNARPLSTQGKISVVIFLIVVFFWLFPQFMSDTVTIYLMYAVGTAILSTSGINLPAFVMIIGFAAIMGLLTPAAAVPSPLFFGPEHITMKNEAKYCAIFLVLDFLIIMFVLWPLANVLIKF